MSKNVFPHHATSDLNYSEVQYTSYRDLGFDLGKCITYENNTLDVDLKRCEVKQSAPF